jgi:tetratricopeptide (TPR) repeat protein
VGECGVQEAGVLATNNGELGMKKIALIILMFIPSVCLTSDANIYFQIMAINLSVDSIKVTPEELSAELKKDSKNNLLRYQRGLAYAKTRNYEKAIKDLEKLVDQDVTDRMSLCQRGYVYFLMGRLDRAILDWNEVLQLDSATIPVYLMRGSAYAFQGKSEFAERDFKKANAISPATAEQFFYRGVSNKILNMNFQAIEDLSKAISLDSTLTIAYLIRAKTHSKLMEYELAMRDINTSLARDSLSWLPYLYSGDINIEFEKPDQAVKDYTKAINLAPDFAWIILKRAQVYQTMKQYDKVIDDCTKIISMNKGGLGIAYFMRGMAYRETGALWLGMSDLMSAERIEKMYK